MRRVMLDGVDHNLLQTFRLQQSIAEAGVPVAMLPEHADRMAWAEEHFGPLAWEVAPDAVKLPGVRIDHRTPRTVVGDVERPLILPHGMVSRCHQLWAERPTRISFAGLMTEQRRVALAPVSEAFGEAFERIETDAGRRWPSKAWDEEYFAALGRSQLVACPDGDYVWTYRFFESAMCGAIPVIENVCDHYEGFEFYEIGDDPASMVWREDWALANRERAEALLTVGHDELVDEVRRLTPRWWRRRPR